MKANKKCKNISLREHVTPWIRESGELKTFSMKNNQDFSKIRVTVDYPEDLEVTNNIVRELNGDIYFNWEKIITLYKEKKSLFEKNQFFSRNEGYFLNSGQKLWKRAKKVIPGGNMLFLKGQRCLFLISGQLITQKQKVVMFGILMEID